MWKYLSKIVVDEEKSDPEILRRVEKFLSP